MTKQQKFNFNIPGKMTYSNIITSEESEVIKPMDKKPDEEATLKFKNIKTNPINDSKGNLKTILEFANEIKITKQQVYRCIKSNSIEVDQINGVIYLNKSAQCIIKSMLFRKNITASESASNMPFETHFETPVDVLNMAVNFLQKEIEKKDQTIEFLQHTIIQYQESLSKEQDTLQNTQKLQLLSGTVNNKALEEKSSIWGKFKAKIGKND